MLDMTRVMPFVRERGARLIGPNCPGLITPGAGQGRHHPGPHLHARAASGSCRAAGTLTYEVVNQLTRAGIGQSTCVGIGGDPIIGTNFIDCLARLRGRSRAPRRS